MRLPILFLLTIITIDAFAQNGKLTTIEIPQIKEVGANRSEFVPESWRILNTAEGELNGDGTTDYVMIFGIKNDILLQNDIDTFRNEVPRILVILLSDKNEWRADVQSFRVVLPSAFGGFFDPIGLTNPLTINNHEKTLTISMYGGNRQRWSINYTFKRNDTDWILVAADKIEYDSASPDVSIVNYSFDFDAKEVKDNNTGQVKNLNWDKQLNLKDFEPFENEVMTGIRI